MSTEQGFLRQAIYCLNKVVHGDKTDVHAQWDRAVLYTDLGHHKRVLPLPFSRHTHTRTNAGLPDLRSSVALSSCEVSEVLDCSCCLSCQCQCIQVCAFSRGKCTEIANSHATDWPTHDTSSTTCQHIYAIQCEVCARTLAYYTMATPHPLA